MLAVRRTDGLTMTKLRGALFATLRHASEKTDVKTKALQSFETAGNLFAKQHILTARKTTSKNVQCRSFADEIVSSTGS